MFFKKSNFKEQQKELTEKLAPLEDLNPQSLSDKELRAVHEYLCTTRDQYKDHIATKNRRHKIADGLQQTSFLGSILGGAGCMFTGALLAVDVALIGGVGTMILGGGGALMFDHLLLEKAPPTLDSLIERLEDETKTRKTAIKQKLAEKHTARKAFVVAERNKQQAKKIKELEQKLNSQQQHNTPTVRKKPIYKPKGQKNVF